MDCHTAREALSARIDGEREPIPAARVDEHLAGCQACRQWQADAVEQTQLLRRLAGRSQVAAVAPPRAGSTQRPRPTGTWARWGLGLTGVVQMVLAIAQGMGVHLGLPHGETVGHVLNESTAWSAALGVAMVAAALRPPVAGGVAWVLAAFVAVLSVYVVSDAIAGGVTVDRVLTHLPVLAGAFLAWLVSRESGPGHSPDQNAMGRAGFPESGPIVLPERASRGRRRGHLRSSDGSAA